MKLTNKIQLYMLIYYAQSALRGPGSSIGVATDYRLDGPGIEFRWRRDFRPLQTGPGGPPSLLYNGYRVFSGGKVRPGRAADHSQPSSVEALEEWRYASTPL
jgi:hypothetical protein